MSSSDDSEVIRRSRHHKKPRRVIDSDSLDGLEEDGDQSGHYGEYAPFFLEIFGTGQEYDYVFEDEKETERAESPSGSAGFDAATCLEYLRNRLPALAEHSLDIGLVKTLAEGCAPEFISLHGSSFTMCQIYYISDLIQVYKKGGAPATASRPPTSPVPGLLSLHDYVANLSSRERLREPSCEIPDSSNKGTLDLSNYAGVINQIATSPVFQDVANLIYEQSRTCVLFGSSPTVTKDMLYRLYATDEATPSNDLRRAIIEGAYKLVDINYKDIDTRLFLCGSNAGQTETSSSLSFSNLFDGLDTLTNCIVSMRGRPGVYAGVFYEKGFCKIVMIDENGEVTGQAAYKEQDMLEIRTYVAGAHTVCISSNTPFVRYFVKSLEVPVLYVPRSLSYFNDLRDYSVAYNIALAVQSPLIYFSRLVYSSSSCLTPLTDTQRGLAARAIRISAAVIKPDWRAVLKHRFSHTLLSVLGISLSQKYFDYSGVNSLESLTSVFTTTEFDNLSTFFTLSDSTQPLDGADVHPKDYSIAGILCQSMFVLNNPGAEDTPVSREAVQSVLSNLQQLRPLTIPDGTESLRQVRALLLAEKPAYFPGANDFQIFQDVVPRLDIKAAGIISKVGKDFYIVECAGSATTRAVSGTATVYVRKTGDYLLNQAVSLDMVEACYHLLSYRATIVDEPAEEGRTFIKHRLFRNVDQSSLQGLMRQDNQNVLVRPSSQKDYYVVVCRLRSDIFSSIKIKMDHSAWGDGICFLHNSVTYSSLDDFIGRYVKGIYRQIRGITAYKHFFRNETEAIAHTRESSQYIRHAVILSTASPGCMEFLYQNKRVLVLIDGDKLTHRDRSFDGVEEFISYAKANFR